MRPSSCDAAWRVTRRPVPRIAARAAPRARCGQVALLAQVQEHQVPDRARGATGRAPPRRSRPPARSRDAPGRPGSARSGRATAARAALHLDVVIELDAQQVDVGQRLGHRRRPAPGVGQVAQRDRPGRPPGLARPRPGSRTSARRRGAAPAARPAAPSASGTGRRRSSGPGPPPRAPGSPRCGRSAVAMPLVAVERDPPPGHARAGSHYRRGRRGCGSAGPRRSAPSSTRRSRADRASAARADPQVEQDARARRPGPGWRCPGNRSPARRTGRTSRRGSPGRVRSPEEPVSSPGRSQCTEVEHSGQDEAPEAGRYTPTGRPVGEKNREISQRLRRGVVYDRARPIRPDPVPGAGRRTSREARVALVFPSSHPLVHHKLAALRDARTGPAEFRRLVRSLADPARPGGDGRPADAARSR